MYCKHCGKEIDDDSKFCKFCGKSQGNTPKGLINKSVWIIYLIWALSNLYLLTGEKWDRDYDFFFPGLFINASGSKWNKMAYDYSEFLVYVFIIPAILYVVYKRYNKQIDKLVDKLLNKK